MMRLNNAYIVCRDTPIGDVHERSMLLLQKGLTTGNGSEL
jgi:hypothetical protein